MSTPTIFVYTKRCIQEGSVLIFEGIKAAFSGNCFDSVDRLSTAQDKCLTTYTVIVLDIE
jgi:hypothetical protein